MGALWWKADSHTLIWSQIFIILTGTIRHRGFWTSFAPANAKNLIVGINSVISLAKYQHQKMMTLTRISAKMMTVRGKARPSRGEMNEKLVTPSRSPWECINMSERAPIIVGGIPNDGIGSRWNQILRKSLSQSETKMKIAVWWRSCPKKWVGPNLFWSVGALTQISREADWQEARSI